MSDAYSFKPASKKQWAFLNNCEAQIIVYGGELAPPFNTFLTR